MNRPGIPKTANPPPPLGGATPWEARIRWGLDPNPLESAVDLEFGMLSSSSRPIERLNLGAAPRTLLFLRPTSPYTYINEKVTLTHHLFSHLNHASTHMNQDFWDEVRENSNSYTL